MGTPFSPIPKCCEFLCEHRNGSDTYCNIDYFHNAYEVQLSVNSSSHELCVRLQVVIYALVVCRHRYNSIDYADVL